ncbi:MAG: ribonuclease P [Candidatus Aenigmatarchaeota archaeon]
MKRKRGIKPQWQIEIAKERIEILFNLAKENIKNHPERSRRYIQLARKIGMRYNIRLSKEKKVLFCKKCNSLLAEGNYEELEKKIPKIKLIKCLNCGEVKKIPK